MVDYTRSAQDAKPEEEERVKVRILATFGETATAAIDSSDFLDYVHVAKLNDNWQIVNVLWIPKPRPTEAE